MTSEDEKSANLTKLENSTELAAKELEDATNVTVADEVVAEALDTTTEALDLTAEEPIFEDLEIVPPAEEEELTPDAVAYLEDDEILLKAADNKLEENDSYAIFKQQEGVVSWTIKNFVDSEGKTYSKQQLKSNPPVLTIESSLGDKADFILSKEFAGSLSGILERVYYGYYGLDKKPKEKFTLAKVKQSMLNAVGTKPLQTGAFVLLSIVVIVGLIAR